MGVIGASMMLALATEKTIKLLEHFCQITGLKQYAVTAVVIALATSLPELGVSVISAMKGAPEIAFGNGVGSNIVNLALVAGMTAVWSRVIMFEHDIAEKKIIWPVAASFLPFVLLIDGRIGRGDGMLLLLTYGVYVWNLIKTSKTQKTNGVDLKNGKMAEVLLRLGWWVTVLLISAGLAVDWARILAEAVRLPLIFVGLFVVAVGTSLPELIFNLAAVNHHRKSLAMGNIIGSNITNATLIIGLAAMMSPINLSPKLVWTTGLQYLFVVLAFVLFTMTKKKLERWEGVALIGLFVYYTMVELIIR